MGTVSHPSGRGSRSGAGNSEPGHECFDFFYKQVLKQPLEGRINAERARRNPKLPVSLTREETARIIAFLGGEHQLIVKLLYGSGLRIKECLRLRIQDIDFVMKTVTVRSGKGAKDRIAPFPGTLEQSLREHMKKVRLLHEQDLKEDYGEVFLPHALARKYPRAGK